MAESLDQRLAALGLTLPPAPQPAGNYVGWTRVGPTIWVAGMGPTWGRELRYAGRVGELSDIDRAEAAARLTTLNLVAQAVQAAAGEPLSGCLKLFGLVHCPAGFTGHERVAAAAAGLLGDLFPAAGPPAVAMTGAPGLPIGITVEFDAVFAVG